MDTWRLRAACCPGAGGPAPDVFFSERDPVMVQWALDTCAVCPVRRECLTTAMETEGGSAWSRAGIWGGHTARERQNLHRRAERSSRPRAELIAQAASWRLPDLGDVLDAHTEERPDGHSRWTIASTSIAVGGIVYTAAQLAFAVGYDRDPVGVVRASCRVSGCITPDHLTDELL
ncbi:MAG: WhiB family transcriptional regulator, partial [Streptomycetaceae bacterium]|nr:WhiB family transcriptional regulator [Streptomycetaceae bacterium]